MLKDTRLINKRKVINDPVYGFISLRHEIIFDLMEHPWFQRLRRIKQLGLSHFVYPGAMHTRFSHALGAMHLMGMAIDSLRSKGVEISLEEDEALCIAILLHDIGHGPFSHALENALIKKVHHERVGLAIMNKLNRHFQGRLDLAIQIFLNQYSRKFMHQLVSSQLDIDRMDYLTRDSFFTGVNEGIIGYDRLLKMMSVKDDQLVWEEKGIHSIEKFILSRSIMYWQGYMHKTVLSAEFLIIDLLKRAQELVDAGHDLPASPMLKWFMEHQPDDDTLENDPEVLNRFLMLDDSDVLVSCKMWISHSDPTLRCLANKLLDRDLHQVILSNQPISPLNLEKWKKSVEEMNAEVITSYLFATGMVENDVYNPAKGAIKILQKDGRIVDFAEVSTHMRHLLEEKNVVKHYVYLPKGCASS